MSSEERDSVLLLGASGFLGPALQEALGPNVAIATHFSHARAKSAFFDARRTRLTEIVGNLPDNPAAGVILFAVTGIDDCARDPAGTAEVNVHGAIRVVDELRVLGIMPVFVSSDAVFDGHRSWWREDDEPRPILTYGRQKLEVERYLATLPPPWLVVRLPKLLAEGRNPRCMLTGWVDALGSEGPILCATDQYFTPAAAADAARGIATLIRERAQGLFHLGGPERLSRRELLGMVLDEYRGFGTARAEIVECSLRDISVAEARPLDTSLCSERFTKRFGGAFREMGAIVKAAVQACLFNPTSRS